MKALGPEAQRRIAEIDTMTIQELQAVIVQCTDEVVAGRLTPSEANHVSRAAENRIKTLKPR